MKQFKLLHVLQVIVILQALNIGHSLDDVVDVVVPIKARP